MKGIIRDELTLEEDRAKVASLMRKGYRSPKEIADIINKDKSNSALYLSPAMVGNDMKALKNEFKEQQVEDYNVVRNEILADLRDAKKTAWEAYVKSTMPRIASVEIEDKVFDEQSMNQLLSITGIISEDEYMSKSAKIRKEHKPEGDKGFLQLMFQIDDKISKIYGVDAPSKVALTDPTGEREATSPLLDIMSKLQEIGNKAETTPQLTGETDDQ